MWDREISVVERRAQPVRRCVAGITRCRISSRDVVRDRAAQRLCAVPFGQVASIADRVRRRERIVIANVAVRAGLDTSGRRNNVSTCQYEPCRAVVELAIRPEHCVVAGCTERGWEVCRHVIGHRTAKGGGAVPVRGVATGVIAVRHRQAVIVVHMALVAIGGSSGRRHLVIAGQSPAGRGVAPRSRGIRRCRRVAVRAIRERKGRAR